MDEQKPSTLLKGFAAITPTQHPEDFEKLRTAFEQAVAEVMSETKSIDITQKTDAKEQT